MTVCNLSCKYFQVMFTTDTNPIIKMYSLGYYGKEKKPKIMT